MKWSTVYPSKIENSDKLQVNEYFYCK